MWVMPPSLALLTSSRHFWILLFKVLPKRANLTRGTIGQKAGFTETLDTEIKKILNVTGTVLRNVALSNKPKPEKGHVVRDEEFLEAIPYHHHY